MPAEVNRERRVERFELQADGMARIEGTAQFEGQTAIGRRFRWGDLSDTLRRDDFLGSRARSLEAADVRFENLDKPVAPLRVHYAIPEAELPVADDGRLYLRPPERLVEGLGIPLQDSRELPVWLPYRLRRDLEVTYVLPPGFRVDRLPGEYRLELGNLRFTSQWRGGSSGKLIWKGTFLRSELEVDPKQYEKLRDFIIDVRRAVRGGAVISPPANTAQGAP